MTEIIASNAGRGIADDLAHLRDRLGAPPLSAWTRFTTGATNRLVNPLVTVDGTVVRARVLAEEARRAEVEIYVTASGSPRMRTRVAIEPGHPWIIALGADDDTASLVALDCRP